MNKIRTKSTVYRLKILICLALAAGTFIAYEPIRHNGFVSYDDNRYITDNTEIKSGLSLQSLCSAFTEPHFYMWHPLTTISHLLDYQLFGLNPVDHHLVSLLFHIINSILLFLILTKMTNTIWPGAFVAAVFALHPLGVESVAWAAERKTVLSGLFFLLTIAVYVWYVKKPDLGRYIFLFLIYALCIMTKPVVVTLPLVLLLLDYWPLERLKFKNPAKPLKWLLLEKVPLLALSAGLSIITLVAQKQGDVVVELGKLPFEFRIANAFLSYIKYIGKTIWPTDLAVIYPIHSSELPMNLAFICAVLFILITIISIYTGRLRKYIAVGWLWFAGTLVPMIGLVQSGAQSMADRYMYISIIGLLIILSWAVKDLIANHRPMRIVTAVSAGVILTTFLILTRAQVKHWQNSLTLFEHTLKVTKNNEIAENGLGCALFEMRKDNDAILHFKNAVRISPKFFEPRNDLGLIYLNQNKSKEALECFNILIEQKPDNLEVQCYLAAALIMENRSVEADKYLKNALPKILDSNVRPDETTNAFRIKRNRTDILNNLAWLISTRKNVTAQDANRAIEFAELACQMTDFKKPEFIDTLAVAYAAAGRFEDAVETAQKALALAKSAGQNDLAREIQGRLELYRLNKPYFEQ